jgi:hypothetical protein
MCRRAAQSNSLQNLLKMSGKLQFAGGFLDSLLIGSNGKLKFAGHRFRV